MSNSSSHLLPSFQPQDESYQRLLFERKRLEYYLYYRQCLYRHHLQMILNKQIPSKMEPLPIQKEISEDLIKEEDSMTYKTSESPILKIEEGHLKVENSESEDNNEIYQKEGKKEGTDKVVLRTQIEGILLFFLRNFGKLSINEMNYHRNLINSNFGNLFDALAEKFESAKKCREDMIRFILRKVITSIRDSLRDQQKLTARAATLALCKKYFGARFDELIKSEPQLENDEELLSFLLPYKRNSRNRTANTSFIMEIFTSTEFHEDYKLFLENLKEILFNENQKKIGKFIDFLMNCVETNQLTRIKYFKRIPWVDTWNESTCVIAYELLDASRSKFINKKPKKIKTKKVKT